MPAFGGVAQPPVLQDDFTPYKHRPKNNKIEGAKTTTMNDQREVEKDSTDNRSATTSQGFLDLPAELHFEIVEYCQRETCLSLNCVSKTIRARCLPRLY